MSEMDDHADDQIDELRSKMRMLQGDRKANLQMLEANKTSNKDTIKMMRSENKQLQMALAQIAQSATKPTAKGADGRAVDAEQLHDIKIQVGKLRQKYDSMSCVSKKHTLHLSNLKDEVSDLELESQRPGRGDHNSAITRKIRILENRLDKAMIKYNEAQSIKKTYEQIVKRLKEERVGFDNQIAAVERTLQARKTDFDELVLLSGDANHANEIMRIKLSEIKSTYDTQRGVRAREISSLEHTLIAKREIMNRVEQREHARKEIIAKQAGDLSKQEEEDVKKKLLLQNIQKGKLDADQNDGKKKVDVFEDAFRKIQEATGVTDINEVIQKILNQEGTTDNLILLTKENQSKIEHLSKTRHDLKEKVEELKYSGHGGMHRRKVVDDHEESLTAASAKLERAKLKFERLAKILISVKAGITHLTDKVHGLDDELGYIEVNDETATQVLRQVQTVLTGILLNPEMLDHIDEMEFNKSMDLSAKSTHSEMSGFPAGEKQSVMSMMSTGGGTMGDAEAEMLSEAVSTRPYNQRVPIGEDGIGQSEPGSDPTAKAGSVGFVEEWASQAAEELTRDAVKRASSQVVLSQEKKNKKKGRSKKDRKLKEPVAGNDDDANGAQGVTTE